MITPETFIQKIPFAKDPIVRVSRDADGNIEYIGIAERGSLTSESKWVIIKLYRDSENRFSYSELSLRNVVFDDRATTVVFA